MRVAATVFTLALLVGQTTLTHLPGAQSKQALELRSALRTRVHNYRLSAPNLADAFVQVAGRFKIPMGIVWIRTPQTPKPVLLSWKAATVREVIADIAHTRSGYEIEEKNAVLHVFPRVIPAGENFLDLNVPRFVSKDLVARQTSMRLHEFAVLKVTPPKPVKGPVRGGTIGSFAGEVGDPEISLDLANVTVGGVLDAISLASPYKVWLVTLAPEGDVTPSGFRRTASPTSDKVFPDQDQPVWEVLKWGEAPY